MKAADARAAERAQPAEAARKLTTFLTATQLDADLVKAAADLSAERAQHAEADQELTTVLAATKGLDADLVKAAEDLAAERARRVEADQKLTTFLTTTQLDADLVKAAEGLAAERARRAEAAQKLTTFLTATQLDANLVRAARRPRRRACPARRGGPEAHRVPPDHRPRRRPDEGRRRPRRRACPARRGGREGSGRADERAPGHAGDHRHCGSGEQQSHRSARCRQRQDLHLRVAEQQAAIEKEDARKSRPRENPSACS